MAESEQATNERVSGMRILVVDDNVDFADSLSELLADCGYQLSTVYDGEAALACIEDQRFDVVLLDLMLPRMSGAQVLRELRVRAPSTEVILVTGVDAQTLHETISPSEVTVLRKPVDAPVLLDTLAHMRSSR